MTISTFFRRHGVAIVVALCLGLLLGALFGCTPKPEADDGGSASYGGRAANPDVGMPYTNATGDTLFIPVFWAGGDGNGTGWRTVGRRDRPLPAAAFWQPDLPISARADTIALGLPAPLAESDTVVFRACVSKLAGATKWPERCTKPGTYVHSFPSEMPDSVWNGQPFTTAAMGWYNSQPRVGSDERVWLSGQTYTNEPTRLHTACLDPDPDPRKVFMRPSLDGTCPFGDSTFVMPPFRRGLCIGRVVDGKVIPRNALGTTVDADLRWPCFHEQAWDQSRYAALPVVPNGQQTNAQRSAVADLNCVRIAIECGSMERCRQAARGVIGCDEVMWRVRSGMPANQFTVVGVQAIG